MISLSAFHPEILSFVTIKSDINKINKANLSVEIDDEFMEAVRTYFKTGEKIVVHRKETYDSGDYEYDVTPIDIYLAICKEAHANAEPGIIYVNRFRNYNIMEKDDDYQIITSNPCFTGDTLVLTDKGYFEIQNLVGQKVNVWNGYEYSEVEPRVTGENQELMKVTFSNGISVKCTPYHKFILKDDNRVEAKDLKLDDKLQRCEFPVIQGHEILYSAYTQGVFSGDGFVNTDRKAKYVILYDKKKDLLPYLHVISQRYEDERRLTVNVDVLFDKTFVPTCDYVISSRLEWLAGLLDTDGTISKDGGLSISSIDKRFLLDIQLMLNTLGVQSVVSVMKKAGRKMMPDGKGGLKEYDCKESYRICISKYYVQQLLHLGLQCHRISIPQSNDVVVNKTRYITIKNIEKLDYKADKVYCFTEYKNHSGIFNGILAAQCGRVLASL